MDFKLDGLPLKRYSLRPTGPDIEDILPDGPVGSHFIRIKIIKYYPSCKRCVWIRKVYVELPHEGSLVFTQNEGIGEKSTDLSNYAEITRFVRDENGFRRCGMMRLHTKHGFKIRHNEELLANISTKTDEEEHLERQAEQEIEEVAKNEILDSDYEESKPKTTQESQVFELILLDDTRTQDFLNPEIRQSGSGCFLGSFFILKISNAHASPRMSLMLTHIF